MRLEYRVLELAKGNENDCSYCFIDYDNQTNLDFSTASATHQMVAHTETEQYFDISFICKDCKAEYDSNAIPRCEKCDKLQRNKKRNTKKILKRYINTDLVFFRNVNFGIE